jgi:hypothetical protein
MRGFDSLVAVDPGRIEAPLINHELVDAFSRLSEESIAGPDHHSQSRARRAMLVAVVFELKVARFPRDLLAPNDHGLGEYGAGPGTRWLEVRKPGNR